MQTPTWIWMDYKNGSPKSSAILPNQVNLILITKHFVPCILLEMNLKFYVNV